MHRTTGENDTIAFSMVAAFFALTFGVWALNGGTATAGTATGAEATVLGVTPLAFIFGGGALAAIAIYTVWPEAAA